MDGARNERLRAARVACGLSQQQLADAADATRQTIGLIEAGRYNPSLKLCRGYAKRSAKRSMTFSGRRRRTMHLIRKWNEYMGPKDERLEAESSRYMKMGYRVLLAGALLCLYYSIMLDQVSDTTGVALCTTAGDRVVPVSLPLAIAVLLAGAVPLALGMQKGIISDRNRYASVERIPWDFVALISLGTGALVGLLTCGMRIIAEVQIVGIDRVTWGGDIAIGVVFFGMAFALSIAFTAAMFHSAIKNRQRLEAELDG